MAYRKSSLLVLAIFAAIRVHAKALPAPWVSVGCYTDTPATHTLNATSILNDGTMTIEACISFCTPNGYTFAGVEFGRECHCDNNIQATGVLTPDSECNETCLGDSTEICGGGDKISIFKRIVPLGWDSIGCYTNNISTPTLKRGATTDALGMTLEECISFCITGRFGLVGVGSGQECFCDVVIQPPGVPASTGCNMTCAGDPNEICGGVNHINIYNHTALNGTRAPPPPVTSIQQTAGTYEYKGCFLDLVNGSSNALGHRKIIPGGTTLELCTSYCKAAGFPVAGFELGHECWCDSYMGLAASAPDSDCNLACQGPNITQACGAMNRLAVYTDSSATPPPLRTCLSNIISLICTVESFRFNLQAVPVAGGTPLILGVMSTTHNQSQPAIYPLISGTDFLPVNRKVDAVTFNFINNTFYPDAVGADGLSVSQNITGVGTQQTFIAMNGQTLRGGTNYCIMPNPFQTFGPFIGPPTIAVGGSNEQWFLCSGTNLTSPTIFFREPVNMTGIACQNVWLSMTYPSVGSTCNGC